MEWIEDALAELSELDEKCIASNWDEQSVARREALVRELWELCQSDPQLAVQSRSGFVAMLERTAKIEGELRQERGAIVQALQDIETSLRQLGAFGDRMNVDAALVDRLA